MAEESGSLEIRHKKADLLERSVGRVGSILPNLLLGTPDAILKDIPEDRAAELQDRLKDINWQGNVQVNLNHSSLMSEMKRLFSRDRRVNFLFRMSVGVLATLSGWISSKGERANYYNPYTESATIYHPNTEVALHEIGHAQDFDQARFPGLRALLYGIPVLRSKLEWNASRNAMQYMTEEEQKKARKVLEPAFATYVASDMVKVGLGLSMFPVSPILKLAPFAGAAAGHVYARLSENHIFGSKNQDTEDEEKHPAAAPAPLKLAAA